MSRGFTVGRWKDNPTERQPWPRLIICSAFLKEQGLVQVLQYKPVKMGGLNKMEPFHIFIMTEHHDLVIISLGPGHQHVIKY